MQDFRKLNVWRKAHQLTLAIYEVTRKFPQDERYGLISQMRRCAASILDHLDDSAHQRLAAEVAEVKKMLTSLTCRVRPSR